MKGMHTVHVSAGEGRFRLDASVTIAPRGITVTACSPDFAHLGATAQAIPRPEADRAATVSVLAVPCHRDEIPAHDIAAALATRFRVPVAASTGFHVDGATKGDIQEFMRATDALIEEITVAVARVRRAGWDDEEPVVAVDERGTVRGPVGRDEAHEGDGELHQAFLTLLVEGAGADARLLLCRRSALKRLWGGVLADACAGHPRPGEGLATAAQRRLMEETGLSVQDAPLEQVGHVVYREDHGDGHCECEWCGVFAARVAPGARPRVNAEEVSEVRRVSLVELSGYLEGRPEPLAPWLSAALRDVGVRGALVRLMEAAAISSRDVGGTPAPDAALGLSFAHMGVPVDAKREGMRLAPPMRLWILDADSSPDGVEYLYFEESSPAPAMMRTHRHAAFFADDLDAAAAWCDEVVLGPFPDTPTQDVLFARKGDALLEFICSHA